MDDGDLIAFVTARLAEVEAAAKAVRQPHEWHQGDQSDPWAGWDRDMIYMWPPEFHTPVEGDKHWRGLQADDDNLAAHIARHDPARVLREVAAGRRILARHSPAEGMAGPCCTWCSDDTDTASLNAPWPCPDVLDLLSRWSDHPDCRQEWNAAG